MKQTIKYLILALLIPAAYCFTACDTDIEPIDQQIIKPDQQDPAQYAAYLAALKAYKASEHYIVYASLVRKRHFCAHCPIHSTSWHLKTPAT